MASNNKKKLSDLQNVPAKIRYPKENELVGVVEKRLGGSRMNVRTTTGKDMLARVPGRAKKFLWIREGDIVLLQPWELDENRADLVYKFKPNEVKALEKKGILGDFESIEEF